MTEPKEPGADLPDPDELRAAAPLARRAEVIELAELPDGSFADVAAHRLTEMNLLAWMSERSALIRREQKLLDVLARQLVDVQAQKDWDAKQRYLAQAVHLRNEVLSLRKEPTT